MSRISGRKKIDETVQVLSSKQIPTQIFVIRREDGEQEAEIRLQPTDDLAAIGVMLAQEGLKLHYDGRNVRVIEPPTGGAPEVVVAEADLTPELPEQRWAWEDTPEITGSAAEYAVDVGLRVQDLVEAKIGTGKDGRILKEDVVKHSERIVTP